MRYPRPPQWDVIGSLMLASWILGYLAGILTPIIHSRLPW